jgi:hypothetical protein
MVYLTVQLTATGLEDQTPLHLPLVPNAATPVPTHILALDLTAGGAPYYETAGIVATTQVPAPIDYKHGRVTLHLPSALLGHTFRFFYRTVDQSMLTVLKPAERFLPADTFAASPPSPTYATDVIGASGDPQFTVLNFLSGKDPANNPVSTSAGMMVSVDYTYLLAGNPTPLQVAGEMHAIPVASGMVNNTAGFYITLNHPGVLSVVAVRAASLRVRAWWRSESGRLQMTDIDTIIPPTPAPS